MAKALTRFCLEGKAIWPSPQATRIASSDSCGSQVGSVSFCGINRLGGAGCDENRLSDSRACHVRVAHSFGALLPKHGGWPSPQETGNRSPAETGCFREPAALVLVHITCDHRRFAKEPANGYVGSLIPDEKGSRREPFSMPPALRAGGPPRTSNPTGTCCPQQPARNGCAVSRRNSGGSPELPFTLTCGARNLSAAT